jgi:hypothetical protein
MICPAPHCLNPGHFELKLMKVVIVVPILNNDPVNQGGVVSFSQACVQATSNWGEDISVFCAHRMHQDFREGLTFSPKTTPLAKQSDCAEMGSTGGSHDTETAHGGTNHRGVAGCPSRQWGPGTLPQARHLRSHVLYVAGQVCGSRNQRREDAPSVGRGKPAVKPRVAEQALDIQALKALTAKHWSRPRRSEPRLSGWRCALGSVSAGCAASSRSIGTRSGIAVNGRKIPPYACGSASLPSASGGRGVPGSMRGYGGKAGRSTIRRWNGFIIATKGSRSGGADGRRQRRSPASPARGPLSPDAVMRWISSMTSLPPAGGSSVSQ